MKTNEMLTLCYTTDEDVIEIDYCTIEGARREFRTNLGHRFLECYIGNPDHAEEVKAKYQALHPDRHYYFNVQEEMEG